jgi:hypothetical protein
VRKTSGTIAGKKTHTQSGGDEAPGIQEAMLVKLASLQNPNNNNNSCCSCHENSPQSLAGCGGDRVRASLLHLLVS